MNKTVDLVNHWAVFEKGHPDAEILDFCRYMLVKEREDKEDQEFLGGAVPPDLYSKFAKLIGRITKIHAGLSLPVLKEHGISSFEDFAFLNSVYKLEQPRKTDVINTNFIELSSGLLIIDRLKKNGWISEKGDEVDKRSKRLSILPKGKKVLELVYKRMAELNQQCFGNILDDDIMLCIQLIAPVEAALITSWLKSRGR
jgi:DNA-binding MarR family transcriptional regulator